MPLLPLLPLLSYRSLASPSPRPAASTTPRPSRSAESADQVLSHRPQHRNGEREIHHHHHAAIRPPVGSRHRHSSSSLLKPFLLCSARPSSRTSGPHRYPHRYPVVFRLATSLFLFLRERSGVGPGMVDGVKTRGDKQSGTPCRSIHQTSTLNPPVRSYKPPRPGTGNNFLRALDLVPHWRHVGRRPCLFKALSATVLFDSLRILLEPDATGVGHPSTSYARPSWHCPMRKPRPILHEPHCFSTKCAIRHLCRQTAAALGENEVGPSCPDSRPSKTRTNSRPPSKSLHHPAAPPFPDDHFQPHSNSEPKPRLLRTYSHLPL
ncbi:hypothetical protein CERZMDRAFT_87156 [Cercospora zeae-maydis SCOH1-5]|uniref:Uncharacterized protein n=1 Tax=Cercospora zeae-maydis SCOH1-5 TaxID=717836 RepID=A0A6A6F6U2_9PEZI|nr:hypothetical protein CERZMDRAFT_87156 [Cercospora zeae-maydis SCOH1-5]